jgi:carbonic anhydrase
LRKLVEGTHHFQANVYRPRREFFARLAEGQRPEALFIACADSRVDPNLITHTEPGELFVLRNAGNLVPPYWTAQGGEAATIEFAVAGLGTRDVIVCGHSHCGAVEALLRPEYACGLPALRAWLRHAEAARRVLAEEGADHAGGDRLLAAVQENVLAQLVNLCTHPVVAERLARGELRVHGWVFLLETGEVLAHDSERRRFVPVAEALPGRWPAERGAPPSPEPRRGE